MNSVSKAMSLTAILPVHTLLMKDAHMHGVQPHENSMHNGKTDGWEDFQHLLCDVHLQQIVVSNCSDSMAVSVMHTAPPHISTASILSCGQDNIVKELMHRYSYATSGRASTDQQRLHCSANAIGWLPMQAGQ